MMLSDKTIEEYCDNYGLITPFQKSKLQPSSYDLTLDDMFYDDVEDDYVLTNTFVLKPNDFVLASTIEKVNIPSNLVGRVEGKSSLGRIGLMTHITAGFIDAGFNGSITLELKNIGNKPISLKVGCSIAQICFISLDKYCENPYNEEDNHYQYQTKVTKSRYEFDGSMYHVC